MQRAGREVGRQARDLKNEIGRLEKKSEDERDSLRKEITHLKREFAKT